ncbi:MAG: MFS transporter [Planctomycetes bacterium]|nr:MFS transporter [Planctomycetota bacterium]
MTAVASGTTPVTPVQRGGMRDAVMSQAFGSLGFLAFGNGVMLLYLTKSGFSSATVLFLLALPAIVQTFLTLPVAFRADREGKKAWINRGGWVRMLGFLPLAAAGFFDADGARLAIVAGILLYAVGQAMLNGSWFALLSPIVPPSMRGAFFGRMRLTWQGAGFAFGITCTVILGREAPLIVMQMIMAAVMMAMFVGILYLRRLPELETPTPDDRHLLVATAEVARAPGYASFCCYAFLLTLVTFSSPNLFVLVEKDVLGFGDQQIVWMGNLLMLGSVLGFLIGGKLVDRMGAKFVFLVAHFAFGAILFTFLLRELVPVAAVAWVGALTCLFGIAQAASSIAISTEMFALIPPTNKSLSTGVCTTLLIAGQGLSGLLVSGALALGLFREKWIMAGSVLSSYDAMLLISAVSVVILVVALGLVPSVMTKAREL